MSTVVDLNLCGIESSEQLGSTSVVLIVTAPSLGDSAEFGYGAVYDSSSLVITEQPGIIELGGLGIPSEEDFRSLQKLAPIPSSEAFGTFFVKRVVRTVSITASVSVPTPAFKNILAYGIVSKESVSAPSIAQINDRPGNNILIASHFPGFVSEEHPRFLAFVESYYKWLETKGNVLYESKRLKNYRDIDTSVDEFVEYLFKEYLPQIPRDALADKKILLKHIKQFYRAKGTEKSYKFFFRILFNSNVEFYYPRVDILRASSGKWVQNKTIRILNVKGNIADLVGQRIRGLNKNCTATVERVFGISSGGTSGYELTLNQSSITGTFGPGEQVESDNTTVLEDGSVVPAVWAIISPIPVSVKIIDNGSSYRVGDVFPIVSLVGKGSGGKVKVEKVDSNGGIQKLSVMAYGLGYSKDEVPVIDFSQPEQTIENNLDSFIDTTPTDRTVAIGIVQMGSTTQYPGYYLDEEGHLSTSKYLQDGHFYQQFSYVTYVSEALTQYKELLRQILHPVGLKHFGGVRIQNRLNTNIKNPKQKPFPTKRQVTLHTPNSKFNIHVETTLRHTILKNPKSFGLGANQYSLYRNRYNYKPFEKYDANDEMRGVNGDYYGDYYDLSAQKAASPIAHFGHMKPSDLEKNAPWVSINMMPDSFIRKEPFVKIGSIFTENFFGNCAITSN